MEKNWHGPWRGSTDFSPPPPPELISPYYKQFMLEKKNGSRRYTPYRSSRPIFPPKEEKEYESGLKNILSTPARLTGEYLENKAREFLHFYKRKYGNGQRQLTQEDVDKLKDFQKYIYDDEYKTSSPEKQKEFDDEFAEFEQQISNPENFESGLTRLARSTVNAAANGTVSIANLMQEYPIISACGVTAGLGLTAYLTATYLNVFAISVEAQLLADCPSYGSSIPLIGGKKTRIRKRRSSKKVRRTVRRK